LNLVLRDKLQAASAAEKAYLAARKGKADSALAVVEQSFIQQLAGLGFASIGTFHDTIRSHGHHWRMLRIIYKPSAEILDGMGECIKSGEDWIGYTYYEHTTIYVPELATANVLVDVDYCNQHGIELAADFADPHGAYIAEPGNFGIMVGIHRPAYGDSVALALRYVAQAMLLKRYNASVLIDNNELMFRGKKIYGGAGADIGKIVIGTAAMTLNFNATLANRILKKRPDHPTIKDPHSLNDLIGRVIDPKEMLTYFIEEWLEATESKALNLEWRTKI